jgi:hypothetical protein
MKREPAAAQPRPRRPVAFMTPRRIWRVFGYRRPIPAPPRFTT